MDGFSLSAEGSAELRAQSEATGTSILDILKTSNLAKIKSWLTPQLPSDKIDTGETTSVVGPITLQINSVANVAQSKQQQKDSLAGGGPQLLLLTVTDGHCTAGALLLTSIPGISMKTRPGEKLFIGGKMLPVKRGMFVLHDPAGIKMLGGTVPAMVAAWDIRRTTGHTVCEKDGGPPAFEALSLSKQREFEKSKGAPRQEEKESSSGEGGKGDARQAVGGGEPDDKYVRRADEQSGSQKRGVSTNARERKGPGRKGRTIHGRLPDPSVCRGKTACPMAADSPRSTAGKGGRGRSSPRGSERWSHLRGRKGGKTDRRSVPGEGTTGGGTARGSPRGSHTDGRGVDGVAQRRVCNFYDRGRCKYGSQCRSLHVDETWNDEVSGGSHQEGRGGDGGGTSSRSNPRAKPTKSRANPASSSVTRRPAEEARRNPRTRAARGGKKTAA